MLPRRPGLPARRTHYYKRNGATTLFASLEVATGKVVHTCMPRHRQQEFVKFLRQVAKAYPRRKLHIVCDNCSTHKAPAVTKRLEKNKRVTLHFTPTWASWMNLVESFFSVISRQAIRRGTFASVTDLVVAIDLFISGWNGRCEPFKWTKTADEILSHAKMVKKTSATEHYVFGAGANVANPTRNDPRSPFPLDTNNVNRFPRWVRLDGGSEWDIELVTITLNPGQASQVVLSALGGANHLFLGEGRFLFL